MAHNKLKDAFRETASQEFIPDKEDWNILKEKLDEQIADCRRYGSRFQRPYREVLKVMDAIENGTQDDLMPYNCTWKTVEEKQKEHKPVEESEDERIRKELIETIRIGRSNGGISFTAEAAKRDIDWLERHSEEEIKKIRSEEYTRGFNDAAGWEKQKEHKPVEESEDERIRKAIERVIRVYGKTQGEFIAGYDMDTLVVHLGEAFSYLEKQKEEEGYEAIPVESTLEYKLGFKAGKDSEKQKEQNPEVKDPFDDEQFRRGYKAGKNDANREQVDTIVDEYNKGYSKGFDDGKTTGYNYAMKEMEQKEQKPSELGEDTELGLDYALQIVIGAKGKLSGYQTDDGIYECDHAIRTIKHILKNGIEQKPAEWSDGDEGMLNCIIATLCEESHGGREANDKMVVWLENRLKSLPPQPHWKPSDEQMEAMEAGIRMFPKEAKYRKELESLYTYLDSILDSLHQEETANFEEEFSEFLDKKADYFSNLRNKQLNETNDEGIAVETDNHVSEETYLFDLEKELKKYFQGHWPGTETAEQCNTDLHFTPPAIMRLAKHFYKLGLNERWITLSEMEWF